MRKNVLAVLGLFVMIFMLVMPVFAQDDDVTPTQEVASEEVVGDDQAVVVVADDPFVTFENIMQLSQFLGLLFVSFYVLHVLGDSIPASKIEQLRMDAKKTDNPFDDMMVEALEYYRALKQAEKSEPDDRTVIDVSGADDLPGELEAAILKV